MLFALGLLLDLLTKSLAARKLKGQPSFTLIPGVLEFHYLENHGAAFSIFEEHQTIFVVIATAAIVLIAWILIRTPASGRYRPFRLCLAAIASGAAGNLADRVSLGYVRDFIYISLIHFPVFNVADIFVTCAVVLLCILILFQYKDEDLAFLMRRKSR